MDVQRVDPAHEMDIRGRPAFRSTMCTERAVFGGYLGLEVSGIPPAFGVAYGVSEKPFLGG
jgi:hypothetical protein